MSAAILFLCGLGFHAWGQWAIHHSAEITRTGDRSHETVGTIVVQRRKCSRCGLIGETTTRSFL